MHVVDYAVLEHWKSLSDEEVVQRVVAGHTALFEVLMRRHNERIYRAARAIVKDEREAEDVMQQAYVNAYSHLRQFDGRAQFCTWLTRIAVHESLARVRRLGRAVEFVPDVHSMHDSPMHPCPVADPERQAFSHELGKFLEHAIDRLPDGAREVFMLRQVEGLSTSEVAAVLDLSEDAVKARFSRARAALRLDLAERIGIASTDAFRFLRPRCDTVVEGVFARIL